MIYIIIFISSCLMISATQPQKFPEAEITNGLIRAHFYLPESGKGYYQGTRFDWSGITTSLEYKGRFNSFIHGQMQIIHMNTLKLFILLKISLK
jgi:hypothetical protein